MGDGVMGDGCDMPAAPLGAVGQPGHNGRGQEGRQGDNVVHAGFHPDGPSRRLDGPRISVVLPTLNEAENLPHVLEGLSQDYEVIIVDGNSNDRTVEVAQTLRPSVRIIRQNGRGKGDALAEGFRAATGEVIVTFDADGSAVAKEIPKFVDALLAGADFVKGSRYLQGGGSDDLTHLRSFGNRLLTQLVNVLYGTEYTDLCYGYNAFWRRLAPLFDVDGTGFEVETLMALSVARAGASVTEMPSYERSRVSGASNLNTFRDGWRVLRMILRERCPGYRTSARSRYPCDTCDRQDERPVGNGDVRKVARITPSLCYGGGRELGRVR